MSINTYFKFNHNVHNLEISPLEIRDPNLSAHQALQLILNSDRVNLQNATNYSIRGIANVIFTQYSAKYENRCCFFKIVDFIGEVFGFESDFTKLEKLHNRIMNTFSSTLPVELVISEPELKIELKEKAAFNAQICISSELETGYIGANPTFFQIVRRPSDRIDFTHFMRDPRLHHAIPETNIIPDYLRDLTFEDNSPLPLDPMDSFLRIEVFHPFGTLKGAIQLPQTLHLPAAIFEDKDDGDVLSLKYKGQLIELEIQQQNHGLKFASGPFTEVLKTAKLTCKNFSDIERPFFNNTDNPYWFYNLGDEGCIYKLDLQEKLDSNNEKVTSPTIEVMEADLMELRPLIEPKRTNHDFITVMNTFNWVIDFPRFLSSDIDLIVNEKYIIFYGKFESRQTKSSFGGEYLQLGREVLASYRWDRSPEFRELTLDQMKDKITQEAKIMFENAQLIFLLPVGEGH
ncbi:MAG: hypothetical protein H0T62_05955 [Parachlamydiaceae bacterium]|nr:hypothetical protein [Parachlamydiaceae bacterium]